MKFSVIVPVYNGEKYLIQTLNSVDNQRFKDYELLVVDHSSKDGSRKIMEEFRKTHSKCKVLEAERFEEERYSFGRSVNKALEIAKGEYIYILGHDDIIDEWFLWNNYVAFMCNKDMNIIQSPLRWFFGREDNVINYTVWMYKDMDELKKRMVQQDVVNCPSVVFKRSIIEKVGNLNSKYLNVVDYEFYMRAIDNGYYIYPSEKFFGVNYRNHDGQCTVQKNKNNDGYPEQELKDFYKNKWNIPS